MDANLSLEQLLQATDRAVREIIAKTGGFGGLALELFGETEPGSGRIKTNFRVTYSSRFETDCEGESGTLQ